MGFLASQSVRMFPIVVQETRLCLIALLELLDIK